VLADPAFRFAEADADRNAAPADHVTTRYEEKKLGDCAPVFLDFIRPGGGSARMIRKVRSILAIGSLSNLISAIRLDKKAQGKT
jgi:hypothetical protein